MPGRRDGARVHAQAAGGSERSRGRPCSTSGRAPGLAVDGRFRHGQRGGPGSLLPPGLHARHDPRPAVAAGRKARRHRLPVSPAIPAPAAFPSHPDCRARDGASGAIARQSCAPERASGAVADGWFAIPHDGRAGKRASHARHPASIKMRARVLCTHPPLRGTRTCVFRSRWRIARSHRCKAAHSIANPADSNASAAHRGCALRA